MLVSFVRKGSKRSVRPGKVFSETDAYSKFAAHGCKSLQARIPGKGGKIPSTFQWDFSNWECASSIPPRSASHSGVPPGYPGKARMGRKCRLFARSTSSPDSQIDNRRAPIGESLRPHPRIFPFYRDCRRRPGSITTAASLSPTIALRRLGTLRVDCRSGLAVVAQPCKGIKCSMIGIKS